ncbi:MAG: AAA-like domain-containing protein [Candidatus Dependentiae bacterium]|nr:AAA-like domain-containing protein [Candidatus Dependentiae bacterium]
MKFFTTAGPIRPEKNYYVPLSTRLNEQELYQLIDQEKYFVLHAPRQTGKTSTILNLAQQLNSQGKYTALYVNVEGAQAARNDYTKGIYTILEEFLDQIKNQLPDQEHIISYIATLLEVKSITGATLKTMLSEWSKNSTKPIVLFIDEIDSLVGDTLISVLRQLRSGYAQRPDAFPQSVCLVGVRDVRDYRIWSHEDQQMILGGSAFNIKAQSLRLSDFTQSQVRDLYRQHTAATGQHFDDDAIAYAFEITQGQPWLVNALAYQACFVMVTDRTQTITKEIIEQAKEALILRRDTHLDVLVDRLQEPRVRHIIDAIITGIDTSIDFPSDDIQYALDLGLIARRNNNLVIANPIYQEVLPRELTYSTQLTMPQQQLWYINPDGLLNMHKMLTEFTQFYRENSAIWLDKFAYKEAGPHLLIMAFFQRIINGGGRVHREYALGRSRLDVLIIWKTQRIVVELKIWHSPKKTLTEGLQQTADYMDRSNATQGHLVIFDRQEKDWNDKIYTRVEKVGNKTITVWGM